MLPTFNQKITILNKVKAIHSGINRDVWVKTILNNCFFNMSRQRNISGTVVTNGSVFICRIPKNYKYKPYNEWIKNLDGFTLSTGDYIVSGTVEEENIDNIIKLIEKYKPNVFQITRFKDNTIFKHLAHYCVEGV